MSDIWKMLLFETLKPTKLSWIMILGPIVLLITGFLLARFAIRPKQRERKIWSFMGKAWLIIGIVIIVGAGLLFIITAQLNKKFDDDYRSRLNNRGHEMVESRDNKMLIRKLLSYDFAPDELRDTSRDYMSNLEGQERINFTQAWFMSSDKGKTLKVFYWPPEEREKLTEQQTVPLGSQKGLSYSLEQEKLYQEKKFFELFESFNPQQWSYLLDAYLNPLKTHAELSEVMLKMCDYLDTEKLKELKSNLFNKRFGEPVTAQKLAWMANAENSEPRFEFFLKNHRWLRECPWMLIYFLIGIWIVLAGAKIRKEGKRNLFPVN